jgi:hypothetical protein
MVKRCLMVLVLALVALPAAARGQTAWDAPFLMPPQSPPGLGIYLADMHAGGLGVIGAWRSAVWNYGLRFGLSEGRGGEDLAVFGGVDYSGLINRASSDFPIDIDWVLGAGVGINNGARLSVPLGLTMGHTFRGQSAAFTPYITPRVILDAFFGDQAQRSGADLGLAVDIGLDLRILGGGGPLGGSTIRFGASLGDRDAVAVGIVF